MRRQTLISWMSLFSLAAFIMVGGCNKTPPTESSSTPAPAPAPASEATPAPSTTPQASVPATPPQEASAPAPAPVAVAPPPPPPPPTPKVYTVPSGTALAVTISEALSSKTNSVGDTLSGTLAQSVRVGGVTVFKSGTPVSGTVVAAKGQGKFKGEGNLGVQLARVGSHSVTTQPYLQTVKGKGKRSAAMIGGGGGGGALIGGLAGGGKGALIGGLIGAGAGTAGAAMTGGKAAALPAETVVSFMTTAPITVTITEKPKATDQ
jgi:hypothetical protein